jgi:cytochrome c oxidase subunit 2
MMRLTATLVLSCLGAAVLLPRIAIAELQWNLKSASATPGHTISDLHLLVMLVITVIFVGVFVFMFYAILRHRKSPGHEGAHFHENTTVEMVWTAIPLLIIIGMAWPATRTLLEIRNIAAPDITIKVTNYQQKTGYEYLDNGIEFTSSLAAPHEQVEGGSSDKGENFSLEVDKPMIVPVGRKVRVLFMSKDVLHTQDVPNPSETQDVIRGVIRDAWFRADTTGTYHVPCAQLCGNDSDSDLMPIVIKVVSEDDFQAWLALQKEPAATGGHDSAREYRIARHIDMLLLGSSKKSMLTARDSKLNELKTVVAITCERNATGNLAGNVAQSTEGHWGCMQAST